MLIFKKLSKAVMLSLLLVATMLASPVWSAETKTHPSEKIFIQLGSGSENLHAAMMAFKIANGLQEKGAEVTVFLNLEAVRIADKRQPNNLVYGFSGGPTMADMYDTFTSKGGKVMVCPMCAHLAGLDEKNLRSGAKIAASVDEIANSLMAANKTLSY